MCIVTHLFYFLFGTICYHQNFDRSLRTSAKFQRSQIRREINDSLLALVCGSFLTAPILVAQLQGYSNVYRFGSASWWYELAQYPLFVLFSDTCMYWLHRVFHAPVLFRMMHSKHHRYVIPTPFSAYAFHPLEAWIMSLPIYTFGFIWPMSDVAQLVVFCSSNIWTFLLHDNRDQFHTVHHKNINYNFGQFLHLWDYLGGTYRDAETFLNPSRRQSKR
ncbi:hypothetical protein CDD80_5156 [Ophiocordyceps camponoti-rufipedis]|uniref:Fatty acid hydroxylase domain-containing protein n=1 Tax=Ophiocordyceps camponoti-rufipedis TaxID=2004952 RepID=A0A2C5ZLP7_9HYPO|nr:hypothetical protein CDD80_5156 [Ophiocordyceps camponoti-rufipedis]